MTLLEYIASLQDQGLSDKEIFDKAQEWKKNNPPVEDKVTSEDIVEEVVVDEAKMKGVVDRTDATAPPKQPDASESLVSGDIELSSQENEFVTTLKNKLLPPEEKITSPDNIEIEEQEPLILGTVPTGDGKYTKGDQAVYSFIQASELTKEQRDLINSDPVFNTVDIFSDNTYEKQIKQAKQILKNQKKLSGSKGPITKEDIYNEALEIIRYEKELELRDQNSEKYLFKISEEEKNYIADIIVEKRNKLTWDLPDFEKNLNKSIETFSKGNDLKNLKSWGNGLNKKTEEIKKLQETVLNNQKKGKESSEDILKYNQSIETYNILLDAYKDLYKKVELQSEKLKFEEADYIKMVMDLEDSNVQLKSLGKIYDKEYKRALDLGLTTASLIVNTAEFAERILTQTLQSGIPISANKEKEDSWIQKQAIKVQEAQEYVAKKFYTPVKFEDAFKSWENFGEWGTDAGITQAPIFAAIASGNMGMLGVSLSSAGQYDISRKTEARTIGGREYDESTVFLQSLGYGASEYIFGALPTSFILKGVYRNATNTTKRAITSGFRNYWNGIVRNAPIDISLATVDAVGEGLTAVTQNGINGDPLMLNVPEATFSGGMFATTFAFSPYLKGAVNAYLSDYNTTSAYRENLRLIEILEGAKNNPWATKEEKQKIEIQQKELLDTNRQVEFDRISKVENNLNKDGVELLLANIKAQENLRIQYEEISKNENISKNDKKSILKNLEFQFNEIQNNTNEFKKAFTNTFALLDRKEKERISLEAVRLLNVEGNQKPSQAQINRKAESIHISEQINKNLSKDKNTLKTLNESGIDVNYKVSYTNAEAIKDFTKLINDRVNDPENSITKEQGQNYINEFTEGINDGSINGINIPSTNLKTGAKTYDSLTSVQNSIANERSQTSVHELGHVITTEALGLDPQAFNELSETVMSWLEVNDKNAYTRIKARTQGQVSEEVLTVFLEEVAGKPEKLEKAKGTGFLGSIGFLLNKATSKVANTDYNYNFKGETDVINFLTQLGKKLKSGELTVGDVKTIQEEGLAGVKPVAEKTTDTTAKTSKSDIGVEASSKVQQIYDTQGVAGAFDIIEQFKPIVGKIVDKRRDAPNFDRQLLTDEIETGERGLFDLIREYKPESGVPLAAYINKFLPARAIEASKRVLGEEFVEDVTEAKGVMAEEVVTEVSEKPVTTLIKPSSLISNDAVAKIKENIASKIKGIDPEQMTFKKLGDLAPEIIAQEIGIPVKKLTDPTANLSKGDANAIQRFVNKNADKLLKILPEGAVVEAATDKLLGTSTGVPKGLLNAFYTKKPRITKGAGLSPFALNKGITKADFLKTFGIVEGKKAEDFSARSSEAQALKGIANLYGRLVTNEIVRSETDLSLEVKQDIAAGKSEAMFSKSLIGKEQITPENLEELKGLSILRSKTDLAKSLRYNSPSINEQNRKTIQDQIQEAVEKFGLDTATLRAGMMGSGGRQSFYGKIVDGKFVKGKKGAIGIKKYVKTTDGRYFLEKSAEGSLGSEITNWVAKPGRLYYGEKDPAYIKLIESAKEYKGKKAVKVNIKNAFTDKAKVQSEINMDVLDHVVNQLTDAVANGMSLDVAGTIIVQSYQATSGLIKIAAPFLYRSNTMEYAGKGSKPEQRKGEKYREEHNPPASVVGAYIMWAIKNNKAQPIMQAIRDNYYQTQLSKKDDFLLDMAKLDSTLPEGFTIFDNPIVRLAAAGIDLNTITNPYTGKTMAESVNAGIPLDVYNSYNESQKLEAISYQNEQIIKAISDPNYNPSQTIKAYLPLVKGKAMASKRNSDLIPDSIKYDKAITVKTSIDALSKADKALNNARKLNAPVKKIRVFDFDDTLARTNSRVIYTMPNFEGGFSPESVRQKAIFMVGGPGAGKTNIGKGLKLGRQGYKVVNQDIALEVMKAEAGLPAKEAEYTTEQISTRAKLGAAARKAAVAKFDKYAANGDGMVIDGTGASYPATMKKVKQLQDAGYEVHMVVANTSLETALARNKARVERSLPDFIVERSWNQVQESTELYRKDFGDKLYEINTEEIGFGEDLPQDFLDKVYAGINSNIQGKLEAGTFAEQATDLEAQGAEWNFSEFSKVIDGKEGPLFKVAKIIADKRGTKDIFVLTARPADAAKPIQQFLKSLGLNIPIKNITGLGDGAAEAKARWIMDKASEGYNDFYFADDVTGNVKAVEEVLNQIDVKSKVQQAKASKKQDFDRVVNDMVFDTAGIETYKKYSAAKARTIGAGKGKYNFFIPAGAEDLTGLLYKMLGKGKKGDAQMAFLKQNLLDTYNRSEISVTQAKIAAMNDFIALKTQLKTLPKTLNKQTGIGKFNYSHAIRVFIWQSQGVEIPGLSKKDIQDLVSFVESDPKLKVFAEQLSTIQKDKPYPLPSDSWLAGTISSDIINDINTIKRAEYQQEFRENVDIIFSEENLNKMEAAYGTNWRAAVEDSIRRMKSGSNRPKGGDSTTQGILDWLNNSVGAVMFLNTRSALLQTISSVNFINWSDNNIFKAGLAFANQKQFWKDFITLMNSDYLVERRNGLKINISESEIADAAANSKNKATAVISYILNKGFVMTQFADSFAIASGGSTFYRNRIKSLVKSGMDPKLAEQRAFEDFRAIAEESQQSSNPVRISKQQASTAGRVILAWANTSMQYARIQKRAIQDLVNGRGNAKANVSKIIYYGIVQNLLFNTLQSAIDAIGFGDDDDDEKEELKNKRKEKAVKVANGMLDSQLRGLGITGAAVSSLKNFLLTLMEENDKKRPEYEEAVEDLFAFSPPLGSKVQKIYGGLRSFSWNKKEMKEKGWSLDNPAYLAVAQVFTGLTNVPVDRVVKKINNMRGIFSELSARWQKIALILGWSTYDVGLPYYGGFDAVEPLTPEEEAAEAVKLMMDQTNTAEQKQMLEELGLTKAEIKELKYEENRVNKIIELKNKPIERTETKEEVKPTKKEVKPKEKVKPKEEVKPKKLTAEQRLQKQFDSIKAENKPDQVKTLTNFGLSKKEIRALKYEEDRVNKILELMSKKQ